jgi:dihydroneopterin aldolase
MTDDRISIHGLTVPTSIGVPEEERALLQTLVLTIHLYPETPLAGLDDDIERTINYDAVCRSIRGLALAKPRRLLETLGEDIASHLFQEQPLLGRCDIELRKSIIPGTECVAVRLQRRRPRNA